MLVSHFTRDPCGDVHNERRGRRRNLDAVRLSDVADDRVVGQRLQVESTVYANDNAPTSTWSAYRCSYDVDDRDGDIECSAALARNHMASCTLLATIAERHRIVTTMAMLTPTDTGLWPPGADHLASRGLNVELGVGPRTNLLRAGRALAALRRPENAPFWRARIVRGRCRQYGSPYSQPRKSTRSFDRDRGSDRSDPKRHSAYSGSASRSRAKTHALSGRFRIDAIGAREFRSLDAAIRERGVIPRQHLVIVRRVLATAVGWRSRRDALAEGAEAAKQTRRNARARS